MGEESLLTGPLEPTNQWYAVAKIADIKMCQAYRKQYGFDAISVMPTNWKTRTHCRHCWGKDISIAELAQLIAGVVGFEGRIEFDKSKPDGTLRKLLDTSRLTALGWQPTIALGEGIAKTYDWCRLNSGPGA